MRSCSSTSPSAHTRACFSASSTSPLGHAERRAACAISPLPWTGKRATYRSRTATVGLSLSAGYRAAAAGHVPTIRWGHRLYVPTARLLELLGVAPEDR